MARGPWGRHPVWRARTLGSIRGRHVGILSDAVALSKNQLHIEGTYTILKRRGTCPTAVGRCGAPLMPMRAAPRPGADSRTQEHGWLDGK